MEAERIIWLLSLVGIVLLPLFRRKEKRVGLLILLFGAFMYGFIEAGFQGGVEADFAPLALVLGLVGVAIGGLWALAGHFKKKKHAGAILLLVISLAASWYVLPLADIALPQWDLEAWLPIGGGEELAVHFIDVGQGDAILIMAPEKNVLIDGGTRGAGQRVVDYIRRQGITYLDLVIATHPHEDHIGGLLAVLSELEVGEVWDPGVAHTTQTFERYLDLIDERDIPFVEARAGMELALGGGARLEVLHPTQTRGLNLNNISIVTRLSYGTVAFMFTGDAEVEAEEQILASGYRLQADVLKVGHHGSSTSSTPAFVEAINPKYAVIMCGQGNRYSHPHQSVLDLFRQEDITVYRTDLHGTVVMTTSGQSISVRTENTAPKEDIFQAPPR